MKIDQVRAELQLAKRCGGQNQKLQKLNFLILLALEAELPCSPEAIKFNLEKKCRKLNFSEDVQRHRLSHNPQNLHLLDMS